MMTACRRNQEMCQFGPTLQFLEIAQGARKMGLGKVRYAYCMRYARCAD